MGAYEICPPNATTRLLFRYYGSGESRGEVTSREEIGPAQRSAT